jgi:hypothetical protein
MNEYVIGGPGGLVGFLEEMGLDGDWNEDAHSLIKNYNTAHNACCSDQKTSASVNFHALYRKIVDSQLGVVGDTFLSKAKEKGFDQIRLVVDASAWRSKGDKKMAVPYEKILS